MCYKRNCPKCGLEIKYASKLSHYYAVKRNGLCRKCVSIKSGFLKRYATVGANTGSSNAFFKKHHSTKSKTEISSKNIVKIRTQLFKNNLSNAFSGDKNPMYRKTVYDIWVRKYGENVDNEKMNETKNKLSIAFSGKNNPMYGKPIPLGSGYGWKGWYKGWFFRSLRELSYMINVIEKNGLQWQSAETQDLSIKYKDYKGRDRTYRADFLIEKIILVEVKPLKLKSSFGVKIKQIAAEKFCAEKGYIYAIEDPPTLSNNYILSLHKNGDIRFTDRYEKMFQSRYL